MYTICQALLAALAANTIGHLSLAVFAGPIRFWSPLAAATLVAVIAGYSAAERLRETSLSPFFDADQSQVLSPLYETRSKEFAMTKLNDLTEKFRHIRLLLAREKGHLEGDRQEGYDVLAPLTDEGRIDADEWKLHRASCSVRRFRTGEEDVIGRLRRKPGGQWYFDYAEGDRDDEIGFHLGDERFVTGEYVSIQRSGAMHTYQVARVERP